MVKISHFKRKILSNESKQALQARMLPDLVSVYIIVS